MAVIIIDTEAKEIREVDETVWRTVGEGSPYQRRLQLKKITPTVLRPIKPRELPGIQPDQLIVIVGRDYLGKKNKDVWAAVTVREMKGMIRKFQEIMKYMEKGEM